MALLHPTRRELIASIPLLATAAAFPLPLLSAALADPPLNFLVIGDWGRDGKAFQHHVARQMARTADQLDSRFVVSTGDNFYRLGVSSKHDGQWKTSFEDIYKADSLQRPWYPVLGNHDYGGSARAQIDRKQVSPRWQMKDYWYVVGGDELTPRRDDVHLFFINTVVWIGKESLPFNLVGADVKKGQQREQKEWLERELGSRKGIKLVFGHHPIYSVGPHGGRRKLDDLDEMLRRHGATAYVCGHDHCLYHISHAGMDYVCSGAGSEVLTGYTGGVDPGCVLAASCGSLPDGLPAPVWNSFLSIAGFAAFTIDAGRVDFRFIDMAGHERHCATLGGPRSAPALGAAPKPQGPRCEGRALQV
jgi:tartrate-resistant acid phosphatase type 5